MGAIARGGPGWAQGVPGGLTFCRSALQTSCSLSGVMVTGTSKGEPRDSPASSRNWIRSRCTSSSGDMLCGTAGSGPGVPAGSGDNPQNPTAPHPGNGTRGGRRSRYGGTRRGSCGGEKHPKGTGVQEEPSRGTRGSGGPPAPLPVSRSRSRSPRPCVRGPHVRRKRRLPAGGPARGAAAPWRPAVGTAQNPRARVRGRSGATSTVTTEALFIEFLK